jgi:predicted nuclease with TOPRIM domain
MKTVDELVAEWSGEEREQLKDLIEECQEREKRLIENSRRSRGILTDLTDSLTSLFSESCEIREKVNMIHDALLGIYLQLYRKKMPVA